MTRFKYTSFNPLCSTLFNKSHIDDSMQLHVHTQRKAQNWRS